MTNIELKAQLDAAIGSQTAANSITPSILNAQLKAIVDFAQALFTPAATILLSDTFTDADAVALPAHTIDSGGSWTRIEGTGSLNSKIMGNKLMNAQDNSGATAYIKNVAQANVKIEAVYHLDPVDGSNGADGAIEILARTVDMNSCIRFSLSGNLLSIIKVVGGTLTVITSQTLTGLAVGDYPIVATVNGNALSLTFNGVTLNATDAHNANVTSHGLRLFGATTTLNTIENFKISTV